ncbi:hypothetical protein [Kribbella sp. CA-247076]|uniref:hypothetical protein n=1 Tax=Kribbella sp. CA-247076 TaxID=3239941 RepID=UPI003D920E82
MVAWILIAVVLFLIGATTVQLARTRRAAGQRGGVRDRGEILTVLTTDVTLLVLARALVDWNVVPWPLWLVGLALTAAAVLLGGMIWDRLPWIASARRPLRIASVTAQVAIAVAATAVLL